jgi:Trk K+ transport system NAD-binding subunit
MYRGAGRTAAGLGLFELAWIGVPVTLTVLVYMQLFGTRLLPARQTASESFADVRNYTTEMLVPDGSPLAGKSIEDAGLRQLPGLYLAEIERDGQIIAAVSSKALLQGGDRLIFTGMLDSVVDLQRIRGLQPATDQVFKLGGPRQDRCFVEAVLSNKSPLIGRSVRAGRFRAHYNAAIIALSRNGERVRRKIGDIVLAAGDTLLLETHPSFVRPATQFPGLPRRRPVRRRASRSIMLGRPSRWRSSRRWSSASRSSCSACWRPHCSRRAP